MSGKMPSRSPLCSFAQIDGFRRPSDNRMMRIQRILHGSATEVTNPGLSDRIASDSPRQLLYKGARSACGAGRFAT